MILLSSFHIGPAVINIYIVVAQFGQSRRHQRVSCLADDRLVDVAGEEIPAVPPHLRGEGEAVVELQLAVVGGVVEAAQRGGGERLDARRRRHPRVCRRRRRREEEQEGGDGEEREREASHRLHLGSAMPSCPRIQSGG